MIHCSATMLVQSHISLQRKLQMERKIYKQNVYMYSMFGKPNSLQAATIPTLMQIGYIKRYNVTRFGRRQTLSHRYRFSTSVASFTRLWSPAPPNIHRLLDVPGTSNALHAISRAIYAKRLTIYAIRGSYVGNRHEATCVNESFQIDSSVKKIFALSNLQAVW